VFDPWEALWSAVEIEVEAEELAAAQTKPRVWVNARSKREDVEALQRGVVAQQETRKEVVGQRYCQRLTPREERFCEDLTRLFREECWSQRYGYPPEGKQLQEHQPVCAEVYDLFARAIGRYQSGEKKSTDPPEEAAPPGWE